MGVMVVELADLIIRAIPALIPLVTAIVALGKGAGPLRSRIRHDVELLAQLPESAARKSLLDFIESEIKALAKFDTEARRDWPMFVVSVIVAPLLGYLAYWFAERAAWWSIPLAAATGLLALLFVYGIFETGQRVPRDEKGKRVSS